jgi:hypothetical protein
MQKYCCGYEYHARRRLVRSAMGVIQGQISYTKLSRAIRTALTFATEM